MSVNKHYWRDTPLTGETSKQKKKGKVRISGNQHVLTPKQVFAFIRNVTSVDPFSFLRGLLMHLLTF